MTTVEWSCTRFDDLSAAQLYAILRLRNEVFIVEQDCLFQDVDDCDQPALHVTGNRADELLCYARILPPGIKYDTPSIGRVVTSQAVRRSGLGRKLMERTLEYCRQSWPDQPITISAQQWLENFYLELGFTTVSEPYLEDDISHLEMVLKARRPGYLSSASSARTSS